MSGNGKQTRDSNRKMIKEAVCSTYGETAPCFYSLRRVPIPYRQILPLSLLKRYQCVVVGIADGMLTLAAADELLMKDLEVLSELTHSTIFLVLAPPARIPLLIHRVERYERSRGKGLSHAQIANHLQLCALLRMAASLNYAQA
ncbi:MAG: hypothetical protein H0W02_12830 [Ktedonobacteraceae bacterium]|nr:hypothetical protein [Ktedonobacteraceae bacterium]